MPGRREARLAIARDDPGAPTLLELWSGFLVDIDVHDLKVDKEFFSRGMTLAWAVSSRAHSAIVTRPINSLALRFPRDAEGGDGWSDGSHERTCDHGCPEEIPAGVA